jgi:hypothetical protein
MSLLLQDTEKSLTTVNQAAELVPDSFCHLKGKKLRSAYNKDLT